MAFYHFQFYNAPKFELSIRNASSIWICDSIANVTLGHSLLSIFSKVFKPSQICIKSSIVKLTDPHEAPELVLGLKLKSLENCASSQENHRLLFSVLRDQNIVEMGLDEILLRGKLVLLKGSVT